MALHLLEHCIVVLDRIYSNSRTLDISSFSDIRSISNTERDYTRIIFGDRRISFEYRINFKFSNTEPDSKKKISDYSIIRINERCTLFEFRSFEKLDLRINLFIHWLETMLSGCGRRCLTHSQ